MRSFVKQCAALALLAMVMPHAADGSEPSRPPSPPRTVREAQRVVDRAWDTFHWAAITGTLKSPETQTEIEQDLHQARGLLVKAREATERRDQPEVRRLLDEIGRRAAHAITASQEPKP
jgi:hypothetical protein